MSKNVKKEKSEQSDISYLPNNLEKMDSFYRKIIRCMPNNVYWMDAENRHMGCNDNVLKMVNLTMEEYIGKTYEELDVTAKWNKGVAESFKRDDMQVMKTKKPIHNEEPVIYDENNEPIYYLTTRVPILDDDGTLLGVVGISTNVTPLKKIEKQLASEIEKNKISYKIKQDLIATAAHEVKNPTTNAVYSINDLREILYKLQNIINKIPEESDYNNNHLSRELSDLASNCLILTDSVDKQLYKINNYLDNLTYLGQLQIEDTNPKFESEKMDILIHQCVKEISDEIEDCNNSFRYNFCSESYESYIIDYDNIKFSLKVLLINAIRFSSNDSRIDINTCLEQIHEQKYFVVSIQDYGCGMSEKQLSNMFSSPYNSSEYNVAKRYSKPSLRLTIAKLKLDVSKSLLSYSSNTSIGTIATLKIPYISLSMENQPPSLNLSNQNIFDARVLLVEDDIDMNNSTVSMLGKLGCKVTSVISGRAAIDFAKTHDYDLIIIDIGLPDLNGVEVIREIKPFLKKDIPIIAHTSHDSEDDEDYFLSEGFMFVMAKPLTLPILKKYLESAFESIRDTD